MRALALHEVEPFVRAGRAEDGHSYGAGNLHRGRAYSTAGAVH